MTRRIILGISSVLYDEASAAVLRNKLQDKKASAPIIDLPAGAGLPEICAGLIAAPGQPDTAWIARTALRSNAAGLFPAPPRRQRS